MSDHTPRDTLLAKIALLAQRGNRQPIGAPPSLEELAMLYDDQLDFNRKQEVISHINNDPTLLKQWTDLVDVMGEQVTEKQSIAKPAFFAWLSHWKILTAGMATASFAMFMVLQQPQDTSLTPGIDTQPSTASQDVIVGNKKTNFTSPDKRAIAAGIVAAQQARNIIPSEALTRIIADVEASSLEATLYQTYYSLGQQLDAASLQCKSQQLSSAQVKTITQTIAQLSTISFIPIAESLKSITTDTDTETTCKKIQTFIESGI